MAECEVAILLIAVLAGLIALIGTAAGILLGFWFGKQSQRGGCNGS